jgi:hypothetical protein
MIQVLDKARDYMVMMFNAAPAIGKEQQYEDAVSTIISLVIVNITALTGKERETFNKILASRDPSTIIDEWDGFWMGIDKPEMVGGNTLICFTVINNLLSDYERNGNFKASDEHMNKVHAAIEQIAELDSLFDASPNLFKNTELND